MARILANAATIWQAGPTANHLKAEFFSVDNPEKTGAFLGD